MQTKKNSDGRISTIWQKKGNQGDEWLNGEVEFFIEPPHTTIFFEAEVIDWKYGDIAIDDIVYSNQPCQSRLKEC